MCGIAGAYRYATGAAALDVAEVAVMAEAMRRRGPDGGGVWRDARGVVALAHRRLSIIDLTQAGAQPMCSADGRLTVTFNGEIYNHGALRSMLESKGFVFHSHSDTEVLLHLYADRGIEMVRDLRGMFAFALWDEPARQLVLARDPLGIKPLYWSDDGHTLRFASQVKALLTSPNVATTPDMAGWAGFYLLGSVPEPHTMYTSIKALPAGSTLTVRPSDRGRAIGYFDVASAYREAEATPARSSCDVEDEFAIRLRDSVAHHLVADVPVGIFLSAGIDSGALAGLMRDATTAPIEAITIAFAEFAGEGRDEAPAAAAIARHYGITHHRRLISEAEFRADLPAILAAMDQPSIDGINTWFVSKAAAELGLKVAVSGLGGDELLGGYPSFRQLPRWTALLGSGIGPIAAAAGHLLTTLSPPLPPKLGALAQLGGTWPGAWLVRRGIFMPWELPGVMGRDEAEAGLAALQPLAHVEARLEPMPRSDFARVATLETSLYMRNQLLRDTDWASMAHSLEVRVPLVDATLLVETARLRAASGRAVDKSALAKAPSKPLPAEIAARPKTGFETPIGKWLAAVQPDGAAEMASEHWSRQWARTLVRPLGQAA